MQSVSGSEEFPSDASKKDCPHGEFSERPSFFSAIGWELLRAYTLCILGLLRHLSGLNIGLFKSYTIGN